MALERTTLVIVSGLPGTGKTTLARRVASELRLPYLAIDDVMGAIPEPMRKKAFPFWETMVDITLRLAEAQLELGAGAVVDAIFMGFDRPLARDMAARHGAAFRPVHTFVSDERLWKERVDRRRAEAPPEWGVATWERIQEQRASFRPWRPGSALFVDGAAPAEQNLAEAVRYIAAERVDLAEL